VAVILAGWGAYAFFSKGGAAYDLTEVKRGEIIQKVSVTGKVKPTESVDLAFERGGKISAINAGVGDVVSDGQILASLTNSDLASQVLQAQANLATQQAKLDELTRGTRPEELQIAQTTVDNAQNSLADAQSNLFNVENKAEVDLDNLYDGALDILNTAYVYADDAVNKQIQDLFVGASSDNPKLTFYTGSQSGSDSESKRKIAGIELAQFKSEIDLLGSSQAAIDAELLKAKSHLDVILDFLNTLSTAVNEATGLSSTTQTNYKYYVNTGRTNVATYSTSVNTKIQTIATQKATNASAITTAQTAANTASNTLASAQNQLALKQAGSTADQINAQAAQVLSARAGVENAQAQLGKTIIRSPIKGIITQKNAKVGEIVAANAAVISILSMDKFEVEANVSENEISKISIGDKVGMTLDSLGPDEKFGGKIIKIDPAETVVSGVIYYKITSVFDAEDARIKSGMTVNMDIETDKLENVLYLPYYLVLEKDGQKYVQILVDDKLQEKTVKTGLEGETMIEIISGLSEGEQVAAGK
jgi:RND family efflux transporter MFP subunit